MKRDMNLVREILIRLEPLDAHAHKAVRLVVGITPLDIPNYSTDEVIYHLLIMTQGGLINSGGINIAKNTMDQYFGLSWDGHEFLDEVRDPKKWAKLQTMAEKAGGMGLNALLELGKAYVRTHGIPL